MFNKLIEYDKKDLLNIDGSKLKEYIGQLEEKLKLARNCLGYINNKDKGCAVGGGEFLKEVPNKYLLKVAPEKSLDPKNKKLGRHQKNTGVFLWKQGYIPEELLGVGANGVVWKCKVGNSYKAVKVTCNKTFGPLKIVNATKDEVEDAGKLKVMDEKDIAYVNYQNKDKQFKASKYLSISKDSGKFDNNKHVFESELASGDLSSSNRNYDIDTIVRMVKQILKGLKVIHDAGYSHNDVKPDNLLIIDRYSNKLKENKKSVKLADFGAMTKIDNTHKIFVNSKFGPPDWYNTSPECVGKRDVYALGTVLLYLIVGSKNINESKKLAKELYSKGPEEFCENYKLKEKYCLKDRKFDSNSFTKLINLLITIQLMVADSYKKRISIDESLEKILKIK